MESFVGNDVDLSHLGLDRDALIDNADSTEGKIMCYTQNGHRWPPWAGFLRKNLFYPGEV